MLRDIRSPLHGSELRPGYRATNKIRIKPYSKKELCVIYDISPRVLAAWLKPFHKQIGKQHGRYYTVLQIEKIFTKLGMPYDLEEG